MPSHGSPAVESPPRYYFITELIPLGFSTSSLRRWVAEGSLPRRKITGRYAFTLEEVERARKRRRNASPADSDAELRAWARRRAAEAPPLSHAQIDLVVGAFAEAMRGGVE